MVGWASRRTTDHRFGSVGLPVTLSSRVVSDPAVAAETWVPRERRVPLPNWIRKEAPFEMTAVARSVTPPVVAPEPFTRSSRTTSLPPCTTKFVAVLFALVSRTSPAPVLRIVPPTVPVPLPVLVTCPA